MSYASGRWKTCKTVCLEDMKARCHTEDLVKNERKLFKFILMKWNGGEDYVDIQERTVQFTRHNKSIIQI
jgi:hypothetical protein